MASLFLNCCRSSGFNLALRALHRRLQQTYRTPRLIPEPTQRHHNFHQMSVPGRQEEVAVLLKNPLQKVRLQTFVSKHEELPNRKT